MKLFIRVLILGLFGVMINGCKPSGAGPEAASVASSSPTVDNGLSKSKVVAKSSEAQLMAKLMEMEQRDKAGNITGLNDPDGLWYKRGDKLPYTGIVAGYYKAKDGEEAIMASKREYKDGTQVGTETNWYENGKKRIELTYENGEAVSMKQWDADGNEFE